MPTCIKRLIGVSALLASMITVAGEADVEDVRLTPLQNDHFRIDVTLRHGDTGWDHYADRWDVLDEAGNVLGSRVLAHPHENEQPFTRSLRLQIPPSVTHIVIRGHDSVHKLGGKTLKVPVPGRSPEASSATAK